MKGGKHMTKNQIDWQSQKEQARHNAATEELTKQSNRTNLLSMQETQRNNIASLAEAAKHNRVYEGETNRHDFATENVSQMQNVINSQHLVRSDSIASRNVDESRRHNMRSEDISQYSAQTNAKYQDRQASVSETNATSTIIRNRNDLALGNKRNEISQQMTNADSALRKAQTAKTYINIGTDVFTSLTEGMKDYTTSLSNLTRVINPLALSGFRK